MCLYFLAQLKSFLELLAEAVRGWYKAAAFMRHPLDKGLCNLIGRQSQKQMRRSVECYLPAYFGTF